MALESGTRLAHYEITDQIGKGGMGEVYRARDTKLGRDVAIKTLPSEFADDADRLARFEREAKLLASLNHPNIAAIYGLEEHEGYRFLVLEIVEGDTLADRMSSGPVPEDEALKIALQIAEAVEAAHEKGVIHRDLKPANVKITPEGTVKVLDFGLAKSFIGDDIDVSLSNSPTMSLQGTQQGVILGTAAYMSPEQVRGRPLDKRTDVWSFGVVLYEMLTGRRLFSGDTVSDIVAGVLRAEPDFDAVPIRFRRLLSRCLERDADKRLRHLGDIRLLLDEASPPVSELPGPAANQSWLVPVLAGVVVVLGAALVLIGLRSGSVPTAEISRTEISLPADIATPTHFSVSPDGRAVAFRAVTPAGAEIWVRDLAEDRSRALEGTLFANAASLHGAILWSSDSRSIAYWVDGELRRLTTDGGPSRRIAELPGPLGSGFWTSDDVIVFDYPGSNGLWQVSAQGGVPERLTTGNFHAYPSLLPDGERFLFTEFIDGRGTVYVGSFDTAPEDQTAVELIRDVDAAQYVEGIDGGFLLVLDEGTVTSQRFDAERLEQSGDAVTLAVDVRSATVPSAGGLLNPLGFSVSARGVVFITARSEGSQLTWFKRDGVALGTVGEAGGWNDVNLSRNGERLATSKAGPGPFDLFIHELVGPPRSRQLTFEPRSDSNPAWSPDGSQIAYTHFSGTETGFDLYLRSADGTGEPEVLLARSHDDYPHAWSSDGRFLVFRAQETPNSPREIWVLPVADGGDPFPIVTSPRQGSMPALSPNDRWLSFSNAQSGGFEVWIQAFDPTPGVEQAAFPVGAGFVSRWSGDSRELFFFSEPDRVLWVVDVAEGPDGNPDVGEPRELFDTDAANFFFDVTPEGDRFIMPVVSQRENAVLRVVLNWASAFDQ